MADREKRYHAARKEGDTQEYLEDVLHSGYEI
jgi:hypothetical protein